MQVPTLWEMKNQDSGFFLFLCIVVNVWNASLLLGPDTFGRAAGTRGVGHKLTPSANSFTFRTGGGPIL